MTSKINVTSSNQKGGVTAGIVNSVEQQNQPTKKTSFIETLLSVVKMVRNFFHI